MDARTHAVIRAPHRLAAAALALALTAFACVAPAWASEEGQAKAQEAMQEKAQGQTEAQGRDNPSEGGNPSEGEQPQNEPFSAQPLDAEGNEVNESQVSDSSFLYDASIADLAGADAYYDGQTVQVEGEAVGEAIEVAGDPSTSAFDSSGVKRVWVTLFEQSSGTSITVWMREADVAKIDTFGAYGSTGTVLRVQGVFNLTCKEHAGESDIHASTVAAIASGSKHPDSFDYRKFIPGLAAVGAGGLLTLAFWRLKERSR